jgi:hypothetical protein
VAILVVCGVALILLHAQRVGSLDCPCRVNDDMLSTRLTIAREGAGPRPPTVQVRVRLPAFWSAHRMNASDAEQLAALLESAARSLRAP